MALVGGSPTSTLGFFNCIFWVKQCEMTATNMPLGLIREVFELLEVQQNSYEGQSGDFTNCVWCFHQRTILRQISLTGI